MQTTFDMTEALAKLDAIGDDTLAYLRSESTHQLPACADAFETADGEALVIHFGHPIGNDELDPSDWWVVKIVLDGSGESTADRSQWRSGYAFTMGDGDMGDGSVARVSLALVDDEDGQWLAAFAHTAEDMERKPLARVLIERA